MKSDKQLKSDIEAELAWDPSIEATGVGVAVKDGVVTLTGHLATYGEKVAIERIASRVAGVRAVAVELDVKVAPEHVRSDTEIAQAVNTALGWNAYVPPDTVRVKVERGWVTLDGDLEWEYQRQAADKAVRPLTGVRGLSNLIALKSRSQPPADLGTRIGDALARHARREAKSIDISVSGSTVTLRGSVDSWAERAAAQGAAYSAPGVGRVVNELTIKA